MAGSDILRVQRELLATGDLRADEARRAGLTALSAGLEKHERALLKALHADLGKGEMEGFTSELLPVRMEIAHALRHLRRWMKPERRRTPLMGFPGRARVIREACGAALIIGPWNYPVQLLLSPLVGALAAGCTAVLKPSELAPKTAAALADLIADTFDPGRVALCQGGSECAEELQKAGFDHVFFTGSGRVGRLVLAAAARSLTPVTLELGGKCPALIFPGSRSAADLLDSLDVVARRIAWGKYLNAGQTCVAPDYVLVHEELYAPLVAALGKAFDQFGLQEHGRMVNEHHFQRVSGYLKEGRVAYGGYVTAEELKISPTILVDIDPGAAVLHEEIFGPVLPVIPCENWEQGLKQVKSLPPPLAIYAFSTDESLKKRIERETTSGGVCFNDTVVQITGSSLPFGGVGESGMGRYHGRASYETFSRERTLLFRPLWPDFNFRYPPAKTDIGKLKKALRFFGGG